MVTIKKEKQLFLTHNSFYQHGNVASACRENSLDQLGLLQNGNYKMRRNILFQMWEENPKWEKKAMQLVGDRKLDDYSRLVQMWRPMKDRLCAVKFITRIPLDPLSESSGLCQFPTSQVLQKIDSSFQN